MTRLAVLILISLLLLVGLSARALSQELSSSLFNTGEQFHADPFASGPSASMVPAPGRQTDDRTLSPAIARASFMAVESPEPRTFAVHDLITIVIREDMQTSFSSTLDTSKSNEYTGEVAEFPRLNLSDLIHFDLAPNTFPNGTLKVDVSGDSDFSGDGDYENQQTMTGRVQARIIDVKPNGNVVLEARKSISSDHETYELVATGTCRVDDITADNTVLSTQVADLFIDKQHKGYVKQASDKGILTRVMDALFNL